MIYLSDTGQRYVRTLFLKLRIHEETKHKDIQMLSSNMNRNEKLNRKIFIKDLWKMELWMDVI